MDTKIKTTFFNLEVQRLSAGVNISEEETIIAGMDGLDDGLGKVDPALAFHGVDAVGHALLPFEEDAHGGEVLDDVWEVVHFTHIMLHMVHDASPPALQRPHPVCHNLLVQLRDLQHLLSVRVEACIPKAVSRTEPPQRPRLCSKQITLHDMRVLLHEVLLFLVEAFGNEDLSSVVG